MLALLLPGGALEAQRPRPGTDAIDPPTPVWRVMVTPDGTTLAAQPVNSGPFMAIFTVKNTGNQPETFTLGCSGTNGITCQPLSPLTLAAGASAAPKVWYSTGSIVGTGRLTLSAVGTHDEAFDTGYFNVPVTGNAAPAVSLAPYNANVHKPSECAASCFDLVWTHTPPAYYTMDAPRTFALTYNSGSARPTPVVLLDVAPGSGSAAVPTSYRVEVRRVSDNVLLTLLNGATSAYFAASSQTTRLAAAVDARTNGALMANAAVTVTVSASFSSGTPAVTSTTISTQLRFLDLTQSNPFGAGFWPSGIQRYYGTTAGPLVIEGDGSQFLYAGWLTPGGTTARLTTDGSTWVRRTYLDGSVIEFDYNTGLPRTAADRFGNTTAYAWSGVQLLTIRDPMGKTTTLTYDPSGNLATMTDPAGRINRYTITSGRLVSIQDPDNVTTTLAYNSLGLLTGITGRSGQTSNYTYDELNRLKTTMAPSIPLYSGGSGRPTTQLYVPQLRIWQPGTPGTTAASAKAAVVPDSMRAFVTVGGAAGNKTLTSAMLTHSGLTTFSAAAAVDGNTAAAAWSTNSAVAGAYLRADLGAGARAVTCVSVYALGAHGGMYDIEYSDDAAAWTRIARSFNPTGLGWRAACFSYAGAHRYWRLLLTNTPGAGSALAELAVEVSPTSFTTFTVDKFGAPTRVVSPVGATTVIARDTASRPTLVTEPSGRQRQTTYTGFLVTQTKDLSTGKTINYTYNALNDVQTIKGDVDRRDFFYHTSAGSGSPIGSLRYVYLGNAAGNVWPALSAGVVVLESPVHNSRGQVTAKLNSASSPPETRSYNPTTGNLEMVEDANGRQTKFKFDAAGRVDTVTVPGLGKMASTFGVMNQRLTRRDPLGNVTQWQYNNDLSVKRVVDPKGQVYKVSYNAVGLVTAKHDLADTTKAEQLSYDLAGNVRSILNRRGDLVTMAYDLVGRMITRNGPDFPAQNFRYDPAGLWKVGFNSNAHDSLTFDLQGRFVTEWQTLAGVAHLTTHIYDARDRVLQRSVLSGAVYATRYAYNADNGVVDTVCVMADCAAVTHDGTLVPSFIRFNPGQPTEWSSFTQYTATRTLSLQSLNPNIPALDQFEMTWTQDSLDWIRSRTAPSVNHGPRRAYTYDGAGRLLNACDSVGSQCLNVRTANTSNAYSYDQAGNRTDLGIVTTIGPGNRINGYGCTGIAYDPNGNVISKHPAVGCQGNISGYVWDAIGQLKEVRLNGVTQATFLYDAFGRRVAKTTSSGTQRYVYDLDHVALDLNGSNAVVAEYSYYPGTDKMFRVKTPAWTAAVIQDPYTGTVRGLAAFTTGATIKRYAEAPWGESAADTGSVVRFRFAGRELDQETGLYYMRRRYYDPQIGRFFSEDPAGLSESLNLYEYAASNPVNYTDPSGAIIGHSGGGGLSGGSVVSTPGINYPEPAGLVAGSALWSLLYFGNTDFAFMDELGAPCRYMTGSQCDKVSVAIANLMAMANSTCKQMGNGAWARFQTADIRYDANTQAFGAVRGRRMFLLFGPMMYDGIIYLGAKAFLPGELMVTIAHEEYHLEFPSALHAEVYSMTDPCAGSL